MAAYGLAPLIDMLDCKIVNYPATKPSIGLDAGGLKTSAPHTGSIHSSQESEHCIVLFWHEFILMVSPALHTNGRVTALCSQHRDGELVSQTAESLGVNVVRGSTSRGGVKAIRALQKASKFSSIVITPDGPRGPRRKLSTGAIFLASKIGLPILPIGVGISSAYRLDTWDRFAIPMPWSRTRLIVGPKIYLPKRLRKKELEKHRIGCERLLNDLTDQAEEWAVGDKDIPNQRRYLRFRRGKELWVEQPGDRLAKKPIGRGATI